MAGISQPVQIDASLLSRYIDTLGAIGWQPQRGIVRPVYSPAWVQAREQLAGWMRAADLEVYGDAVGNLFGRLRGSDESRTILTGSHFDTVPFGGIFDGVLGILAGLVALRALREQAGQPRRSLEVVALCEEEAQSIRPEVTIEDGVGRCTGVSPKAFGAGAVGSHHGSISTPGLRSHLGSSALFTDLSAEAKSSGRSWSYQRRWSRPTA